ncbi:SUMF1/EgtB/PvdO family nonheme iron enzyme [Flammeovirga aprica]|uniref:SUMF1/EgtB/PvdO family nonheme iron enzyme n=1 Tax=Flammeovirga aprica JL-4 TaxID=694437 RepID=A0A7X9XCT5_9BACT|nr:SUMF1/EgtB/PvdO family nonheme iron enzyme [Flammeovirga aprica]NME72147.1 SUMF1/EgtB/PvdO family nonheme iron enzyme [Flammeovirga aprica JL-4]
MFLKNLIKSCLVIFIGLLNSFASFSQDREIEIFHTDSTFQQIFNLEGKDLSYQIQKDSSRKEVRYYLSGSSFEKEVLAYKLTTNFFFFNNCTFKEKADFRNNTSYYTNLAGSVFNKDAYFDYSDFGGYGEGVFQMDGSHFLEKASFIGVNFSGSDLNMSNTFGNPTIFEKEVIFDEAIFFWSVCFEETQFNGPASFRKTTFETACFTGSKFASTTDFSNLNCKGNLLINECDFKGKVNFKGAKIKGIILDGVKTEETIDLTKLNKDSNFIKIHFTDINPQKLKFDYQYFQLRFLERAELEEIEEIYHRTIQIQKQHGFKKGLAKAEKELKDLQTVYQLFEEGKAFMAENNKYVASEKFEEAITYFQENTTEYGGDFNVSYTSPIFKIYVDVLYHQGKTELLSNGKIEAFNCFKKAYEMDSENDSVNLELGKLMIELGVGHLSNANQMNYGDSEAGTELKRLRNNTFFTHHDITLNSSFSFYDQDVKEIEITPDISINLRKIEPSVFEMMGRDSVTHKVQLDPYYIAEFEIQQYVYDTVMGKNPSLIDFGYYHPVESISYYDAQRFIIQLNEMTGYSFRLPTEAEWEYAASGGSPKYMYAGSDDIDLVGNYLNNKEPLNGLDGSLGVTTPSGSYEENYHSLYDMTGNVKEWVLDTYSSFSSETQNNPKDLSKGYGILKGGSYNDVKEDCTIRRRYIAEKTSKSSEYGFRIVLDCE